MNSPELDSRSASAERSTAAEARTDVHLQATTISVFPQRKCRGGPTGGANDLAVRRALVGNVRQGAPPAGARALSV
jgi:hypothetical protein